MERRHELPTHLGVEDHILGNLTMRQLLALLSGLATAYAIWSQAPGPAPIRAMLAALVLLPALAATLMRPGGRSLAIWFLVILRYVALPKIAVWCPKLPDEGNEQQDANWADNAPRLAWAGEQSDIRRSQRVDMEAAA